MENVTSTFDTNWPLCVTVPETLPVLTVGPQPMARKMTHDNTEPMAMRDTTELLGSRVRIF